MKKLLAPIGTEKKLLARYGISCRSSLNPLRHNSLQKVKNSIGTIDAIGIRDLPIGKESSWERKNVF
jgi:hypothetical protein